MTKLYIVLIIFPVEYLKELITPKTTKLLKNPMNLGEFIPWLECWFYMDFWVRISNRKNWWPTAEPKMYESAPLRLNTHTSRTRFEGIIYSLRYKDRNYVKYNDGFFNMHLMGEAQNRNTAEEFNPSWINLLGKSMIEWFNKYATRFMCIGRKTHPLGNERHTIFCGLTSIFEELR